MPPDRSPYDPGQQPRKETRQIVPAISMAIGVDFNTAAGLIIGRLWDISASGACLLFPPIVPVDIGDAGPITLHHPSIGDPICSHFRIAWVDRLTHASYSGGVFTQGVDFESTFLGTLMRRPNDNGGLSLTDLRSNLTHFPGFH